mmetsp:Transcript_20251/g.65126  ORF Transcript_20251/g.65126 Transcript_20251/m.65126 type:complete len:290 (-) Transcript_20251:1166-2035(-)
MPERRQVEALAPALAAHALGERAVLFHDAGFAVVSIAEVKVPEAELALGGVHDGDAEVLVVRAALAHLTAIPRARVELAPHAHARHAEACACVAVEVLHVAMDVARSELEHALGVQLLASRQGFHLVVRARRGGIGGCSRPLHVPMRHDHDRLHVVLLSHEGASFLEEALDLCKAALHAAVEANQAEVAHLVVEVEVLRRRNAAPALAIGLGTPQEGALLRRGHRVHRIVLGVPPASIVRFRSQLSARRAIVPKVVVARYHQLVGAQDVVRELVVDLHNVAAIGLRRQG